MRSKVSLVAASVVALGWATAHAQTGTSVDVDVGSGSRMGAETTDPSLPAPSTTTTSPGTTTTTPGTTITTPPGSNVNVDTGSGNVQVSPSPSTTTTTPPATTPPATTPPAGTNVDINTPGAGGVNVQTPPGTETDVDVNVPETPSATVPESSSAATTGAVTEPGMAAPAIPPPAVTPVDYDEDAAARRYGSRLGAGVLVGGGFEDFTSNGMQGITEYGGSWNARLILGARQFIGFEGAYVGSARSINTLGVDNDAVLVSNGAEGALRLNIPVQFDAGRSLISPFGFVGLGWQRYDVTNSAVSATSSIAGRDDVMTVPFGGGLALAYSAFMADARFTYRQTYYNDMLRSTLAGGNLNTWGVSGNVGFIF